MSALGKAMPPFGHSRTACSTAASRLSAHETCNWMMRGIVAGSLPASLAPFSKRPSSVRIFSSGAPTVMMPSAMRPVRSPLTGPEVAM